MRRKGFLLVVGGAWVLACARPGARAPAPVAEPSPVAVRPPPQAVEPTGRVEILWDTWGVPHVFAQDEVALFWAFGWAQMESHRELLLRLYGQARGRAAEYWGEAYLESDRWLWTNGIPRRAEEWYTRQSPHIRAYLDAFVEGVNAYARTHPDSIPAEFAPVLPVTAADVLAHAQRVTHFTFVAGGAAGAIRAWLNGGAEGGEADPAGRQPRDGGSDTWTVAPAVAATPADVAAGGSNAWAVAPSRSDGGALLLANPHLPWGDLFTWYEAHLVLPAMNAYGASLVGFPVLAIAFNDHLGWTHTVNTFDGADLYELTLAGGGYSWDGEVRAFEAEPVALRVRRADGSVAEESLLVRRSAHGPVVAQRGERALALRVVGLDRPHLLEQTWQMMRSRSLGEFEAALGNLQLPMFTVMYADREGHILHLFNGQVPLRPRGDWRYWSGIVPGDSAATLWTGIHPYHELPRVVDPPTGWLQNANDPPWTTTFPMPLRPENYPAYMAPVLPLASRPQRSARLLAEDSLITFEEFQAYKHSTRAEAADHILEDVIVAARAHGTDRARRAADVLRTWDRATDADSRGAVLFEAFYRQFVRRRWPGGNPFDVGWIATSPFSTPDGLSDPRGAALILEAAAADVEATYGTLDVAWGEVYRLRRDDVELPANGGPGGMGVFRVVGFDEADDGRSVAASGDSFVAAVQFGTTLRAAALLTYGNSSQPGSPHRADQLPLFARKQLRPVWRSRTEIEANLEKREAY